MPPFVAGELTYNGESFPILWYQHELNRNQTIVVIQSAFTSVFTSYSGSGILSRSISGKVKISTGIYAGTHNSWYIYTNSSWGIKRTNIYIDAPWKGTVPTETLTYNGKTYPILGYEKLKKQGTTIFVFLES